MKLDLNQEEVEDLFASCSKECGTFNNLSENLTRMG